MAVLSLLINLLNSLIATHQKDNHRLHRRIKLVMLNQAPNKLLHNSLSNKIVTKLNHLLKISPMKISLKTQAVMLTKAHQNNLKLLQRMRIVIHNKAHQMMITVNLTTNNVVQALEVMITALLNPMFVLIPLKMILAISLNKLALHQL